MCAFLAGWGELIESFTEIESGRKNDRPELTAALDACRHHKATLVIAKLDRLATNGYFIFAANTLPIIRDLQAQGITSHKALARALNAHGIPTANRRQWYGTTVKNLLQRTSGQKLGIFQAIPFGDGDLADDTGDD